MNLKKVAVGSALALTLTLGLMMFGGRSAQAAGTWYVSTTGVPTGVSGGSCSSPSFNSIGAAVAIASSGDTIQVCAGTYNEQVQITKTLTLKGAQAGVDARTRVAASESIINNSNGPVQIMADNVVLDGFTIQGSTGSDPAFLSGIWSNPGYSGSQGGHRILNNIVQNNISGIELDSTCAANPTLVQFNLIRNNNNPGPGTGNAIQTNFGLCNATIDNNKFSGHTSSSVLVASFSGSDNNITVSNNELVGGAAESIAFLAVSNSAITGNKSIGSTSSGTIDLFGGNSNITVTGNVLRNGQRGLWVENPYGIPYGVSPNTGITAHNNCFVGNALAGLEVTAGSHSGVLNAESNWWGSANGPTIASNPSGTGDKIIDPGAVVDYTPFLTSDAATPCAAPPVGPPTNKDQCKDDGWKSFNVPRKFKNQGDCIQYVNTGK